MRKLIKEADPDVVEEWKWMGTPVWSHDGIICTGEILQERREAYLRQGRVSEGSGPSLQLESRRKRTPRSPGATNSAVNELVLRRQIPWRSVRPAGHQVAGS